MDRRWGGIQKPENSQNPWPEVGFHVTPAPVRKTHSTPSRSRVDLAAADPDRLRDAPGSGIRGSKIAYWVSVTSIDTCPFEEGTVSCAIGHDGTPQP
jgi:hypothetical protein